MTNSIIAVHLPVAFAVDGASGHNPDHPVARNAYVHAAREPANKGTTMSLLITDETADEELQGFIFHDQQ
jgi:hypothetical protein